LQLMSFAVTDIGQATEETGHDSDYDDDDSNYESGEDVNDKVHSVWQRSQQQHKSVWSIRLKAKNSREYWIAGFGI
jgi:hypothetical protein